VSTRSLEEKGVRIEFKIVVTAEDRVALSQSKLSMLAYGAPELAEAFSKSLDKELEVRGKPPIKLAVSAMSFQQPEIKRPTPTPTAANVATVAGTPTFNGQAIGGPSTSSSASAKEAETGEKEGRNNVLLLTVLISVVLVLLIVLLNRRGTAMIMPEELAMDSVARAPAPGAASSRGGVAGAPGAAAPTASQLAARQRTKKSTKVGIADNDFDGIARR
jgi:hypothetical protein